ncbi:chemotaxis protein CheB [Flavihumibacter sp. R14]|nr:chemotaxis protein CheB [Flavihumibacter soli]
MAQDMITRSEPALMVIGGSAGSLDVLMSVLPLIRKDLQVPIIIVVHRKNNADSSLIQLLSAKSRLKVKEADDKDDILPGWIYICPADYHLLIETDHTLSLDVSEKVNYSRPSIDITLQTAAEAYGTALTCLLLSGASTDGAEGLEFAGKKGAVIAVQDPSSAEVSYMPQKAIERNPTAHILKPGEIAAFINSAGEQSGG